MKLTEEQEGGVCQAFASTGRMWVSGLGSQTVLGYQWLAFMLRHYADFWAVLVPGRSETAEQRQ